MNLQKKSVLLNALNGYLGRGVVNLVQFGSGIIVDVAGSKSTLVTFAVVRRFI
jgi:hypothetical protein